MSKIISIATENILPHCGELLDNHRRYAARRGFEYECFTKLHWPDLAASFSKVPAIQEALDQGHEYVTWVDADIAFMRMDWDITKLISDKLADRPELFLVALQQANWQSWKYLCNGLMTFRNTPYTHKYMAQWTDYCLNGVPNVEPGKKVLLRDRPWEQYCQDQCNRDTGYHGIYACTHNEIGAFCESTWHDGVPFRLGMPTIHFATGEWERRAEIFRTKYAKHVTD